MRTWNAESRESFTCPPTSHSSVELDEQTLWETILEQHGLGLSRGVSRNLGYGAQYFDSTSILDYQTPTNNIRHVSRNYQLATALLEKMKTGLSQNQAAKTLGLNKRRASRTLQRFRARVKTTCPPTSHSSEGTQE